MSAFAIKILAVEDNPGDARLLQEALSEIAEVKPVFVHKETLANACDYLNGNTPDVILLDLGLPDSQGLETVRRTNAAAPDVPIIVLTAQNDGDLAVRALQQGAQDYLVKSHVDNGGLWRAVRYAMERQRMQIERLNFALADELAGLYSRRGFISLCECHLKLALRVGKPFLVAFIDLDGMKQINDTFGHQEGDRALVDAANVLRDSFRQSDVVARLGGDEFAVLSIGSTKEHIEIITARIRESLAECNASPGRRYQLSLSIGFAQSELQQRPQIDQLLAQADTLMYRQKQGKKAVPEPAGRGEQRMGAK